MSTAAFNEENMGVTLMRFNAVDLGWGDGWTLSVEEVQATVGRVVEASMQRVEVWWYFIACCVVGRARSVDRKSR